MFIAWHLHVLGLLSYTSIQEFLFLACLSLELLYFKWQDFVSRGTVCRKTQSTFIPSKIDFSLKCTDGPNLLYICQKGAVSFSFSIMCSWALQWTFLRFHNFRLADYALIPVWLHVVWKFGHLQQEIVTSTIH